MLSMWFTGLFCSCRWWRKWRPLLVASHQRRSRIQRVTVAFCNSCPIFKFMYNLYSWLVIHCFMMTKFKEVSLLYLVWCFAQCGPTQWFKDIAVCADIKVTTITCCVLNFYCSSHFMLWIINSGDGGTLACSAMAWVHSRGHSPRMYHWGDGWLCIYLHCGIIYVVHNYAVACSRVPSRVKF